MAVSELVVMESSELEDRLVESRRELFNLRFQKATGQLDNTARMGHVRRDIARILTVLRQRDLGIDESASWGGAVTPARAIEVEPEDVGAETLDASDAVGEAALGTGAAEADEAVR